MLSSQFTRSVAGTALAAGTLGLAALLAAGTANASTAADEQFLSALQQQGVSIGNPQTAVDVGHQVCTALGHGTSPRDISQQLTSSNPGMQQQASLYFIIDSARSYCPQYVHHNSDGTVTISAAR